MIFPEDQILELKAAFPGVMAYEEGNQTVFLMPQVQMPDGCSPTKVDLLLWPAARDGYPSRLFFAEKVTSRKQPNWNCPARIIERNWLAYSWKRIGDLRLAQMVVDHLGALR